MDLERNEFLSLDRRTPYLGGYQERDRIEVKPIPKKNESRLRRMINDTAMKPIFPDRDNNLHTFQRTDKNPIRATHNSHSHQNLPRASRVVSYQQHNPEPSDRPDFDLGNKRPQQQVESELQKLNRRRQFSRKYLESHHQAGRERVESIIETRIKQDKIKHPQKYLILGTECGMSDQQIYHMKQDNLNFQLQSFTRNKGLEYLKDASYKIHTSSKLSRSKTESSQMLLGQSEKKKYPNYIPQVFAGLKPRKKQSASSHLKVPQIPPKPPVYVDERTSKLAQLANRQQILGKVVLQKVKKHFKHEKQPSNNYFSRVKSQETIDDSLIEFLRAKIDRAEVALK